MLKKEKNISFVPAEAQRTNRFVMGLTLEQNLAPLHLLRKRLEQLNSANARGVEKFLIVMDHTIHCSVISIFDLVY